MQHRQDQLLRARCVPRIAQTATGVIDDDSSVVVPSAEKNQISNIFSQYRRWPTPYLVPVRATQDGDRAAPAVSVCVLCALSVVSVGDPRAHRIADQSSRAHRRLLRMCVRSRVVELAAVVGRREEP